MNMIAPYTSKRMKNGSTNTAFLTWLHTEMDIGTNSFRAVIAAWLNASQRSRHGLGMNRSARGLSVKRFVQSQGLETALYNKNIDRVQDLNFLGLTFNEQLNWNFK